MKIALVINADQQAVVTLRALVGRLREAGHAVRPYLTFEGGDACRMAREAAEAGCELVVAAGGDGTINEAVNGIHDFMQARGGTAAPPRLGIVPLGTANDFASAMRIPAALDQAIAFAVVGDVVIADVGLVNDRCFINVSTGGFGAEATDETPDEIKSALGPLAYLITGMKKFATLEASEASFTGEELIYEGPFLMYAVGNSWRTGGGNRLTPHADLTDGMLDLCVVTEMSRMEFIRMLPNLRNGSHVDHPAVIYRQLPRVVVESARELSVNADGEALRSRRLEYAISPHRLPIVVPARDEIGPEG